MILLSDANIIIDFIKADFDALKIICSNLNIVIPSVIIQDEIKQLSGKDAEDIGIEIVSEKIDQLLEASTGTTRISFYDKLCLILSRDNDWTCISNDKKLHSECKKHKVNIIWGLELILLAVTKGVISKDRSILCFSRLQTVNSRMNGKIEEEFLTRLGGIECE